MANVTSLNNKDWVRYNYTAEITLNYDKVKTLKLENVQIHSFMIEKDFESDLFPVIMLDVSLQSTIQIKEDMEFVVNIYKFISNSDNRILGRKIMISETFKPIVQDTTPYDKRAMKAIDSKSAAKETELQPRDLTYTRTMILVKKTDYIASKMVINEVLSNVNMETAVAYLLSQAGFKKVLMSSFDNTTVYKELLLLPIPLGSQLNYLRTYYGWHKQDSSVFIDFDAAYVTKLDGSCSVWRRNEPKTICFNINTSVTDETNIIQGSRLEGETLYINVARDSFTTIGNNTVADQTSGNNVILYDANNDRASNINGMQSSLGNASVTTMQTYGHNPYIQQQIALRKSETSAVQLKCENLDLTFFTPNKQYKIIGTDSAISKTLYGNYRLQKMVSSFSKSGNHFISMTILTLIKSK